MKRTLAITAVFVAMNGVGVVYPVVVNHGPPASAVTAPIAPARGSDRPPARSAAVPAAPPAIAASTPDPSAIETPAATPHALSQTGQHKPADQTAVGSRPAKPTTVPKLGPQRRPGADSRSILSRP